MENLWNLFSFFSPINLYFQTYWCLYKSNFTFHLPTRPESLTCLTFWSITFWASIQFHFIDIISRHRQSRSPFLSSLQFPFLCNLKLLSLKSKWMGIELDVISYSWLLSTRRLQQLWLLMLFFYIMFLAITLV